MTVNSKATPGSGLNPYGLSISLPEAPEGGAAAPPVVVLAATDPQQ